MLTANFYLHLAGLVKSEPQGRGTFFMAMGRGQPSWDRKPPPYERNTQQLVDEVMRKVVGLEDAHYLDEMRQETEIPSARLQFRSTFAAGEGEGTLRECGLFIGGGGESNSGTLLSYFIHPRIEKESDSTLQRRVQIDLTPHSSGPGQIVTRYLGNSNSQEFHDLENVQAGCQVDEIRFDRKIYFGSPEQATALGYDHCAHCFGRELSER